MSDAKTKYTTTVAKAKNIAIVSKAIEKHLSSGVKRANMHKNNWTKVNINDIVEKFTPGAYHYDSNGKVIFSNGGRYIVVADVAGGYLRIQDLSYTGQKVYVTIDGKYISDFKCKKEWQKNSHYRILKREEM